MWTPARPTTLSHGRARTESRRIELDSQKPFTAARARNAGLRRLRELYPQLSYVQFIDGDCELIPGWLEHAYALS